jgi:hypothetical protein
MGLFIFKTMIKSYCILRFFQRPDQTNNHQVFVVEQDGDPKKPFNKGKLFNVAFLEACLFFMGYLVGSVGSVIPYRYTLLAVNPQLAN